MHCFASFSIEEMALVKSGVLWPNPPLTANQNSEQNNTKVPHNMIVIYNPMFVLISNLFSYFCLSTCAREKLNKRKKVNVLGIY